LKIKSRFRDHNSILNEEEKDMKARTEIVKLFIKRKEDGKFGSDVKK
jgi:hypothetical protein